MKFLKRSDIIGQVITGVWMREVRTKDDAECLPPEALCDGPEDDELDWKLRDVILRLGDGQFLNCLNKGWRVDHDLSTVPISYLNDAETASWCDSCLGKEITEVLNIMGGACPDVGFILADGSVLCNQYQIHGTSAAVIPSQKVSAFLQAALTHWSAR